MTPSIGGFGLLAGGVVAAGAGWGLMGHRRRAVARVAFPLALAGLALSVRGLGVLSLPQSAVGVAVALTVAWIPGGPVRWAFRRGPATPDRVRGRWLAVAGHVGDLGGIAAMLCGFRWATVVLLVGGTAALWWLMSLAQRAREPERAEAGGADDATDDEGLGGAALPGA